MSQLFRSQTMTYQLVVMPRESAWEILNELGNLSSLHFVDHDPNLPLINRPFANYIKRCEEISIKLDLIGKEMVKWGIQPRKCTNYQDFLDDMRIKLNQRQKAPRTYFEDVEQEVNVRVQKLNEQIRTFETMQENKNTVQEYKAAINGASNLLGNSNIGSNQLEQYGVRLNKIVGTILNSEIQRFEKMIFRVTKGNAWVRQELIDESFQLIDPITLKPCQKSVVLIIYPGGSMDILKNKLSRICDTFQVNRFEYPDNEAEIGNKIKQLTEQSAENQQLVQQTRSHILEILKQFEENSDKGIKYSYIEELKMTILKEKTIYHTMNMLKINNSVFQGHCWIPDCQVQQVNQVFENLNKKDQNQHYGQLTEAIPRQGMQPPTYFEVNDFTAPAQQIVNTYGVPRYKEINPGFFTLITFPFMFGVMFGDIAHGGLLLIFGLFLIFKEESLRNSSVFSLMLPFRYLLALMGFFAFYCGFIYNDFTSISLDLFGSCYQPDVIGSCAEYGGKPEGPEACYQPKHPGSCAYVMGIDPIWAKADNNIQFVNSLKMKLAVIIGVIHMSGGILLKGVNAIYFKQPLDFFFEFIPQITFMLLTFGYMDFLIFFKWSSNYSQTFTLAPPPDPKTFTQYLNTFQAPSIINVMINMPLKMGNPQGPNIFPAYSFSDSQTSTTVIEQFYEDPQNAQISSFQTSLQQVFLIIAVLCIPMMLLPKPLIIKNQMAKKNAHHAQKQRGPDEHLSSSQNLETDLKDKPLLESHELSDAGSHGAHGAHDSFSEIFVHQVIETIEFVLGSISNTASYLRLWALSLAHSQLAEVFFGMLIEGAVESGGWANVFMLTIKYYMFALVSFGVLMCMDLMECFLHALRLHWIEFQNKFFKADGYIFTPFSFIGTMKKNEEDSN